MITACIISKNEEKNIEKCLDSLTKAGFEIVLVDTGSKDKTVELAKKYTKNIYFFKWNGDFSAARNYALEKAGGDYVLVIDCDEYVISGTASQLEESMIKNDDQVGRILCCNYMTKDGERCENKEWLNRVFNKNKFKYFGHVHEQVTAFNKEKYVAYKTSLVIGHTGYDLSIEEKEKKAERNIELLMSELVEYENDKDRYVEELPYTYYQLGKSYYMIKNYDKAIFYFEKATVYDLDPKIDYVIDLVETYGYALIDNKEFEKALSFQGLYDTFGDSADFNFLMGLIYMNNGAFDMAVQCFERATEFDFCKNSGVNSYFANFNIGVIFECLGDYVNAKEYYNKCGNYAKARERLGLLE